MSTENSFELDIPAFKIDFGQDAVRVVSSFCEDYDLTLFETVFEPFEVLEVFVRRVCAVTNVLDVFRPKTLAYEAILNFFQPYFSLSHIEKPSSREDPPASVEKVVYACFHLPNGLYKYYKILIKLSDISNAGMGAFALEDIPKGAMSQYQGVVETKKTMNPLYSWAIQKYNHEGKPRKGTLHFLDATSKRSNWLRYVNCGPLSISNNMKVIQVYDKIFYVTRRPVMAGSEFYIDYGVEYRLKHLHIYDY
jgi:hypothetical protein